MTLPARSVSMFAAALLAGAAMASSAPNGQVSLIDAVIEFSDLRGVALDDLPLGAQVRITGVPLAPFADGRMVAQREATLALERFTVLRPGAKVFVEGPEGRTPVDTSSLLLLGGEIEGEPGSVAYVGLSDAGVYGFLHTAEGTYSISTGPAVGAPDSLPADAPVMVTHAGAFPAADNAGPFCGYHPSIAKLNPRPQALDAVEEPRFGSRSVPCRVVEIAIDTDWEYTQRFFGGNPNSSALYAVSLLGGVSQIFKSELNVRLATNFVRTWSSNSDPYHMGGNLLDEFTAHWGANMGSVPRDLAHIFSGNYGGGVAYLNAICEGWGYGLSGLNGSFPSPIVNRHSGNWDLFVTAHELGHNFGTGHTHDSYTPVIDGCGNGDCSQALGGTIMSYCHTCSGGMNNIDLLFGPRVQERIWQYLNTRSCLVPTLGDRVAVNDAATVVQGGTVDIHVLDNDSDASCQTFQLVSYSLTSAAGGTITLVSPTPGPTQHLTRRYLRYTAPANFSGTDTFSYSITGGSTAQVAVTVVAARPGENPAATTPGVDVRYFVIPTLSVLPNFALVPSYIRDNVPAINFSSTTGPFATSGRNDNVGAVFNGLVNIPASGLYTLSLTSDDGSKLFLGNTLLIDNDGLHGMATKTATVGLAAGAHAVRIEYFERTGGAGLILAINGSGLPLQPVPQSMWTSYCPSDVNASGDIDVMDFLDYIDAFGTCSGSPNGACAVNGIRGDFNGDGITDILDILDFLDAFGSGC